MESTAATLCKGDSQLYKLLNQTAEMTAANRDSILVLSKTLKDILHNLRNTTANNDDYTPSPLLHSCEEIKSQYADNPSDYYIIADGTGHARHVYCQMEQVCGSSGWMRVAYLNMSDPTEECPSGFRLYTQNGVRACGRQVTSGGSCQSVQFPSFGITYSDVCGQVYGYQKGSTDAYAQGSNLNGIYGDGISLTYGNPRKHIWSFIAGMQENFIHYTGGSDCPCATGSTQTSPSFVGNDYILL